ncbi:MAG TPA: hypothetical protein DCP75_12625 [Haliea salexigens]|uniref:Uncharacterized protein n=1 Tax=Haliea salexigens TaxID=287487 RepID=A0A3C1KPB7_9GAMM|nr:hypothetical protein [Haliea sp.]HAN28542.1 hypothetical protein [Haliea salexigens]|tara:strand:- start:857 stop:1138 length:282 start_codon:yes stop_codon:yes gene_type:complete
MNTVLTIIAILGLGALLVSVVLFTMAARRYVSDDEPEQISLVPNTGRDHQPRSRGDRRQTNAPTLFPITVNGELITRERRQIADRRQQPRQYG